MHGCFKIRVHDKINIPVMHGQHWDRQNIVFDFKDSVRTYKTVDSSAMK